MTNTDEHFSVFVVEDDEAVLASLCALLAAHGIDGAARFAGGKGRGGDFDDI